MHPIMTEAIAHQHHAERRRLAEKHRLSRTGRAVLGANPIARWRPRRVVRRPVPPGDTTRD